MDLYQLRYFLEVARELSFTRAAANLHLSPPAVSRSVALLEKSLKRRLFARSKRRVSLTPEGLILKERAERIYDQIEKARGDLAGEAGSVPLLRVGSREMITDYLLPGPLLEFGRRHPETRFGLHELAPEATAEALKKDQLDFALHYSDLPDPALEARSLGRLTSSVYGSSRAWPAARRPKSLRELLEFPFVAPRYFRADPSRPSLDGFPDRTHPRNIRYEAEFLETHRRFVLDGLAFAVLPDLVIAEELRRGSVFRCPGPRIFREIFFLKRRERPLPKAVEFFRSLVRNAVREAGRP